MFAGKWLLHLLAGGHYNMVPLAWLPLVLLWLEKAMRERSLLFASWAGAAFALIILNQGLASYWTSVQTIRLISQSVYRVIVPLENLPD